ncbi:catalase-like [Anticarsia gemmatalis]|uniref:catalase-like n=1 Tax=Anticarsia gemmatalis TaxID=129554 RepID=UPI003F773E33
MMAVVTAKIRNDPVDDQMVIFKEKTLGPIGVMTTAAGAPINLKEATVTLNEKLISNEFFMESMTHFVRERIPERVVHAKAAGAFGYFEVTHDFSDICKAKLFNRVGKRTPVAARFSPVIQERGSIDTSRETRGFGIKFYTEEGNFDIVGLNTPMYAYKDPILFPTFVRVQRRNPSTNVFDPNMLWDFITLRPESLHVFLMVFGDRGIPDGYRHMPGFSVHTYQLVNDRGENYFVRFHFMPDLGIKTLRSKKAKKIAGEDPDYATKDLYRAIGNGDFPSWTVSVQVLTLNDVKNAGFDVFDLTKVLPLDKYPLRPLGKLVLNKNPINYFAEIEQLALSPSHLVPGILGAPDKVFEARRLAYRDAQYYRLGGNFFNIPVNCPLQSKPLTYNRDSEAPLNDNMRDIPNYYPNTFNGPVPYVDKDGVDLIDIYQGPPNNYDQARELYVNEMTSDERTRLVENIVDSLRKVTKSLKDRAVKAFQLVHSDLSERVREGLLANRTRCDYEL